MRFVKMHGIGNDYVYVDSVADPDIANRDLPELARVIADRHTGVGGDGLIVISRPDLDSTHAVRMRMFNADGSEAEMCGNGVRCVAKYAIDYGLVDSDDGRVLVQTGAGLLDIQTHPGSNGVGAATVDMGKPVLSLPKIPVIESKLAGGSDGVYTIAVDDMTYDITFVSLGNPHGVIFADEIETIPLEQIGPKLERHAAFPNRMNIHVVKVHSREEVTMRTWERGSGITRACGTGASAVCVAAALTDQTDRTILAHLPGGDLTLQWDKNSNRVFMTGPATEVFNGEWIDPVVTAR